MALTTYATAWLLSLPFVICQPEINELTTIPLSEENIIYTSPNNFDIVKIISDPTNTKSYDDADEHKFFFVEGSMKDNGTECRGLYIFKNKTAHKLLDNGCDASLFVDVNNNITTDVYLAAPDGIHKYNPDTDTAEKYGTVTDDIIAIAKTEKDLIYYVTKNKELFKVTDGGTNKQKIEEIKNVVDIAYNYASDLFYITDEKQPYVYNADGIQKIGNVPKDVSADIRLMKSHLIPPGFVLILINTTAYRVRVGTEENTEWMIHLKDKPTAFAFETSYKHIYAYNKNIYVYNLLSILSDILKGQH